MPVPAKKMKTFFRTDIGCQRESNQDAGQTGSIGEQTAWVVVCDGVGGANGGSVASAIAVTAITEKIKAEYRPGMSGKEAEILLREAFGIANYRIYEQALQVPKLVGMGTTGVAAIADGENLYVAHVGDSRVYLYQNEALSQLTVDHSLVQELINLGQLTEEQARIHPRRNYITRALGVAQTVQTDFSQHKLYSGDVVLACTDGLTNYADKQKLTDLIGAYTGEALVNAGIEFALQSGGSDNVTVATVDARL